MENSCISNHHSLYIHKLQINKIKYYALCLFLFVLMLTTTGCVSLNDPEVSQEFFTDRVAVIDPQTTVIQSITTHRSGLDSITVWLSTPSDQNNPQTTTATETLNVAIYHDSIETNPVFKTSLVTTLTQNITPVTVLIPNTAIDAGVRLFFQFSTTSGAIQINGRNQDIYVNGQSFINRQPVDSDIAFRVSYDYGVNALITDIGYGIRYFGLILPLLLVTWLPGWLLLDFSGLRSRLDFGEQSGLAIGISLAFYPLVMLWTTIFKIHWSRTGIFIFSGSLGILLIYRILHKSLLSYRRMESSYNNPQKRFLFSIVSLGKAQTVDALLLISIFIAALILRLVMVRDLATPAWVDSVHHALLTKLILSNGGYPPSLLPFLNILPTTYHMGFHALVATFTWLSNLPLDKALLIFGQVLNAIIVFPIYLLSKNLTRSSKTGLFAALITGFLTPMPAYYTSWGRYTELAGLIIIPSAFVLIRSLAYQLTTRQRNWIIILGAITSAGLFMVHYRVIAFLFGLIISYLLVYVLLSKTNLAGPRIITFLRVLLVAAISMILVSPWMYQTVKSTVAPFLSQLESNPTPYFQDFSWAFLTSALGKQALIVCGLGLFWGIIKNKRFPYLLIVWISILFLIANLGALRLPGGGLISSSSVEIMLFIPISILGAYFVDQLLLSWKSLTSSKFSFIVNGASFILIIWITLMGSKALVGIINPITVLSRAADLPAIAWINDNIPANETVVINPFAWGYGVYAGSDGGYWISPLSGRPTLPPPVLYGLGSNAIKINEQCQKIIDLSSNPAGLREYFLANQLHYIFVGAKGGVISPELLSSSEDFTTLFHQNGVWILQVKP